ncbi:MAG: hypothetical protein GY793_08505 [Proteobacteria bacterium]|nr:hypothetical protein [Pseudomonadota bacterium]
MKEKNIKHNDWKVNLTNKCVKEITVKRLNGIILFILCLIVFAGWFFFKMENIPFIVHPVEDEKNFALFCCVISLVSITFWLAFWQWSMIFDSFREFSDFFNVRASLRSLNRKDRFLVLTILNHEKDVFTIYEHHYLCDKYGNHDADGKYAQTQLIELVNDCDMFVNKKILKQIKGRVGVFNYELTWAAKYHLKKLNKHGKYNKIG